ncbi:hypothetical protein AB0I10_24450 [Streptomyces sp. NPDC050636]|uniref:hypothetical protein n=1 Tax=Streptomyces sp. NPDC050636 TaxID=3154510 RepID=UPI0034405B7E
MDGVLKAYAPFPAVPEPPHCMGMDAVWVLNYPQPTVETEAWQRPRTLISHLDQTVRDQSVLDQAVRDQSVIVQSVFDQSVFDQARHDISGGHR